MAEDKKTGDMAKPTPEESRDDREQDLSTESEQISKEKVEERLATEELDDFAETEVPVSETETETEQGATHEESAPVPVIQERIVEKRGGFGAAVLGGVVAALIGFVAGKGDVLDSVLPPSLRGSSVDIEPLQTAQAELKSQLADLRGSVSAIDVPDLEPIDARLSALETAQVAEDQPGSDLNAEVTQTLQGLSDRVAALEARPITEGASADAVEAFETELQRVRDSLSEQQAEVKRMVTEAQEMERASAEAARIAAAQSVVSRLRSALDAGAPYGDLVAELSRLQVEVPEDIQVAADTGVATLAGLRDGFAPAARAALAAAREETKGSGGIMAYVNRHLGARSVAPREGDDPDAILSRAGAAVEGADISAALDELAALPDSAKAQLEAWQTSARIRLDAEAATDALSQSLNAN
ncbi:COG4223 family protein [Tritonibacter mobilis]|uniref:COG4223 family protein n=2 Tax=Tritonibacter mobilis TaxID=379347 RepID=UPI000806E33E|nr:hypothetical protein [Tritonibacter mobilis]